MYTIYTKPKSFTKNWVEACQIAERYYHATGEIVAVENKESNTISFPSDH